MPKWHFLSFHLEPFSRIDVSKQSNLLCNIIILYYSVETSTIVPAPRHFDQYMLKLRPATSSLWRYSSRGIKLPTMASFVNHSTFSLAPVSAAME